MKKILLSISIILVLLVAGFSLAHAAITFTTSVLKATATGSTCVLPSLTATAGQALVVTAQINKNSVTATIASSPSDSWSTAVYATSSAGAVYIFYAPNVSSGATVTTVTLSGSATSSCQETEYANLGTGAILDVTNNSSTAVSSTAMVSGSSTTNFVNELLIGNGLASSTAATFTAGTSFTLKATSTIGAVEYRIVSSNSSYSTPMTLGTAVGWIDAMATFIGTPTPPGTPTYPTIASTTLTASWTSGANSTYYSLTRSTSANGTYTQITTTTLLTYGDTGLTGNTSYWYKVNGVNVAGSSTYSASSTVLTLPNTPGTPTYGTPASSSLIISWTAPTGGAAYYSLARAPSANGTYTQVTTTTLLTYTNTGLSNNTSYWYEVRGVNTTGNGSYSATSTSATTGPPDATSVSTTTTNGGRSGNSITITGTNFGTVTTSNAANCSGGVGTGCVKFIVGGTDTVASASITSWSNTSITFTISPTLASNGGASALQVWAADASDTTPLSFYIYPNISAVTALGANAAREYNASDTDGLIMLSGDHFGTSGTSTILGSTATQYGSIAGPCTVGGYTSTSVCLEVPTGIANNNYSGTVILNRSSDNMQATTSLSILPRITAINPSSTAAGTVMQIIGNHFCQTGTCPTTPNRSSTTNNITLGGGSVSAPSFVQYAGNNTNSQTISCTTGNLLVFSGWSDGGSGLTLGVSDTASITWHTVANGSGLSSRPTAMWYGICAGGSDTISLTGASNDIAVAVDEYSFTGTPSLDVATSVINGNDPITITFNPSASGELGLVGADDPSGQGATTTSSGWTLRSTQWVNLFDNTNVSAGSQTFNMSHIGGATGFWNIIAGTIKFSGGGSIVPDSSFVNNTGGAGTCNGSGAAWSDGEMCATIPLSAPTGTIGTTIISNGNISNSYSFNILAAVPGAPGTPTYSSVSSSTLTVSWTAPSSGATYYSLARATSSNGTYAQVTTTTGLSYGDSGLSPSTNYWYEVRGVNGSGNGAYSATSTVTTSGSSAPPNAPSQSAPGNGAQNISTTPTFLMTATSNDAYSLEYKVTIYSNSGCSSGVVQTDDESSSQTGWTGQNTSSSHEYTSGTQGSFTIQSALSGSTQYYWKASAKDPDGSNTWTDSATCNSFTTTSGNWTTDSGSWSISSNKLVVTPGTGNYVQLHVTGQSVTNDVVEYNVSASGGSAGDTSAIFRADSGSNRYSLGDADYVDQLHRIGKTISSSYSTITSTSLTLSGSTVYDARGYANGTALQSWINGSTALSTTDGALSSAGFVGIGASGNNTFSYDDFAVYTSPTITLSSLPGGGSWSVLDHSGAAISCTTGGTWSASTYTGQVPIDYDNGGGSIAVWTNGTCSGSSTATYPSSGLANDIFGGDTYTYNAAGSSFATIPAVSASTTITISSVGLISD